jgi:hypothetical protein
MRRRRVKSCMRVSTGSPRVRVIPLIPHVGVVVPARVKSRKCVHVRKQGAAGGIPCTWFVDGREGRLLPLTG